MTKRKTSKIKSAPEKDKTREVNRKPSKSKKDAPEDVSKTNSNKSNKIGATKSKKCIEGKLKIKFKKNAIISLAKNTKAPKKKSDKQSTSLIAKAKDCPLSNNDDVATFPKKTSISNRLTKKQKSEDNCNDREVNRTTNGLVTCKGTIKNRASRKRLNSNNDFQQTVEVGENIQPLTLEGKDPPKKMRGRRKSNLSDISTETCSSNGLTTSKRKRLPSPDTPHTIIKRAKLKGECPSKANGLNITKNPVEKCPLKNVTISCKRVSQEFQPTSSLGTQSCRARRALNRHLSTEMDPIDDSLVPQIAEKEPVNNIGNGKPIDELSSKEDSSEIQSSTLLDKASETTTSDCTSDSTSDCTSESTSDCTSDILSSEDLFLDAEEALVWSSPPTSPDHSIFFSDECTSKYEENKCSPDDDPLFDLKKELENPFIEIKSSPKPPCDNIDNCLSVESMLSSPATSSDEKSSLIAKNQTLLSCQESPPVKACNIVIQRLSPKEIQGKTSCGTNSTPPKLIHVPIQRLSPKDIKGKISCGTNSTPPKLIHVPNSDKNQTLNVHFNENVNESEGYSPETELNPLLIGSSSGGVSDSLLKDKDSSEKDIKASLPNERMSNQVLGTNEGAVQISAPRPKLSILKLRQKSKMVKSMIKTRCNNGFERIVVFDGKKKNITDIKITKVFSDSNNKVTQRNVIEKEKYSTDENCVIKQNINDVSYPKCNEISPPFNKDVRQQILVDENPQLDGGTLHQQTNLQPNKVFECKITDPENNAMNSKLKNNFTSKPLRKPITFNDDFRPISSNSTLENSRIRIKGVYQSQEGNESLKNIQPALGKKRIGGEVKNCTTENLKRSGYNSVDETPISQKQCSRIIMLEDNTGFENVNSPSENPPMNDGFNQELPSTDFSFAVPKPPTQPKVTQAPADLDHDDDLDSVISLYVSDDLMNDVSCNETDTKQRKATWNKFDRYNRNSDEEDEEEEDYSRPSTSRLDSCVKSSGVTKVHSSKNIVHEEKKTPSNNPSNLSRIEKFNFWNQKSEHFVNKGYVRDQDQQTISFQNNANNQFGSRKYYQDSLINDYCLVYLRSSNESHTGCNLIHKVPYHIFSACSIKDEEKIESAIKEILKDDFRNPPIGLVSAIVTYCVGSRATVSEIRTTTLVILAKCLKRVNGVNAIQLWCTFLTAILNAQSNSINANMKCSVISTVLGQTFEERMDFVNEDLEAFKLIQKALIEVHAVLNSKVQLLSCLAFISEMKLKNRFDLKLISPEFAISVIKQCSDAVNYKYQTTWRKFAYKVLSTFLSNYSFVEVLLRHDKHSIIRFFELLQLHNVGDLSSYNFLKIKQLISGNEFSKPSLEEIRQPQLSSPSSHTSTEIFSNHPSTDIAPNSYTISKGLVRSYDTRELNVEEVYSCFKSPDGKETFLHCLPSLREDVKKFLSDVIMSFMSDEADNERWDNCYKFFTSLSRWDFRTVRNFKENTSPTSNVLNAILVLLKKNKITEAFELYCEYEFWKPEGDWALNHNPADVEKSRNICLLFEKVIKVLDTDTFYHITIKLVTLQDTLAMPINLVENVSCLIQQLIETRQHEKVLQLLTRVFDEGKSKLLSLPNAHFYRILVVILCREGDVALASMLFFRAMNRVDLYPSLPKIRTVISSEREMCVELHSSLRSEEIKVIAYAILKMFGKIIQNVGFFVKFKQYFDRFQQVVPGPLKRYLLVEDPSISNGVKRFRESVRELIPNAIFKPRGEDGVEMEKISIKEYVYNQNE